MSLLWKIFLILCIPIFWRISFIALFTLCQYVSCTNCKSFKKSNYIKSIFKFPISSLMPIGWINEWMYEWISEWINEMWFLLKVPYFLLLLVAIYSSTLPSNLSQISSSYFGITIFSFSHYIIYQSLNHSSHLFRTFVPRSQSFCLP